jgi:hypothetical protein
MKARVKATGEIVEVYQSSYNLGEFYDTETGTETYDVSELELLGTIIPITTEEIPDYWTRLEHQYAGMAMQAIISKQTVGHKLNTITDLCCDIAHTLVEKLKEKEE